MAQYTKTYIETVLGSLEGVQRANQVIEHLKSSFKHDESDLGDAYDGCQGNGYEFDLDRNLAQILKASGWKLMVWKPSVGWVMEDVDGMCLTHLGGYVYRGDRREIIERAVP